MYQKQIENTETYENIEIWHGVFNRDPDAFIKNLHLSVPPEEEQENEHPLTLNF